MSKPEIRVAFPENPTLKSMNRLALELDGIVDGSNVIVDLGVNSVMTPRFMLYLYPSVKRLRLDQRELEVKFENIEYNGYARHIGFFDAAEIEVDEFKFRTATTDNYIPLQELPTKLWLKDLNYTGLSEHIDTKCDALSSVLCKGMGSLEKEFLHYNLREIVRNVFEHSRAETISFVAQCWPKFRKAEIAISDTGVGLQATTSRNIHKSILSDLDAVNAAILPGFSGSDRVNFGDPWDNTGYGLYMTSEIGRKLGQFTIVSGSYGRETSKNICREITSSLNGTFISIELVWDEVAITPGFLTQLVMEGQKKSKEHFGGNERKASASSGGRR